MSPGDHVRVLVHLGHYHRWGKVLAVEGPHVRIEAGPLHHRKQFWVRASDLMPAAEWRRRAPRRYGRR